MTSNCGQELTKADFLTALLWDACFHLRCRVGPGKQTISSRQSQPMPQGQLRKSLAGEQPSKRPVHCLDHPLSSNCATCPRAPILSQCRPTEALSFKGLANSRSFWSSEPSSSSPAKLHHVKIWEFCQFLLLFLTHMFLPPEQDETGGSEKTAGTEMRGISFRKVSCVPIIICMI